MQRIDNTRKKKNELAQIVTTVLCSSHSHLNAVLSEVWHSCDGHYDEYCLGCHTSEDSSCAFY